MAIANALRSGPRVQRQSDIAYRSLRDALIRCQFPPGEEISEAALAERLALGKVAVREALVRLSQEGLVQPIPRVGYRVTAVTFKDILDIFEMRAIIEPAAARLACGKVSEAVLREADDAWRRAHDSAEGCAQAGGLESNKAFHLAIARATGNERLINMLARVLDETDRLIYLGLPIAFERAEVQEGHGPIIEALVRGAEEEAMRAAARHVDIARAIVVDAVVSTPSVLDVEIPLQRPALERHS